MSSPEWGDAESLRLTSVPPIRTGFSAQSVFPMSDMLKIKEPATSW